MTNAKAAEILGGVYCQCDSATEYKEALFRGISALSLFTDEEVAERKREILARSLEMAEDDG